MPQAHSHYTRAQLIDMAMFQHQLDATLNQAAPVQNTWYTVLDTTNARVYSLMSLIAGIGETIEVRLTLDAQVYIGSQAQVANQYYPWYIYGAFAALINAGPGAAIRINQYTFVEGKIVRIEVRKTTAAGAGNLQATIVWARRT